MSFKTPFGSIDIFLEKRKTRLYVGRLSFLKEVGVFEFVYDDAYLYSKNIIPLGPEFSLTKRVHRSPTLFPSLQDRIPSRDNPAYPEYCNAMGISIEEHDPIVLLGTIGKKGPSSFVFEPVYEKQFTKEDLIAFRRALGLTTREFAICFDLSQAALTRIETGKSSGRDLLKRIEIYKNFPEVAIDEIQHHGGGIDAHKRREAVKYLKKMTSP